MINQSFSAENFEKIFQIENRKGEIKKDFFPEAYILKANEIKEKRREAQNLRLLYSDEDVDRILYNNSKLEIEQTIKALVNEKEEIIYNHLKSISHQVNHSTFKFNFNVGERYEKSTYELDENKEAQYYTIKQLQYNIRKTFGVKQADRYSILKQIQRLLSDGLPKIIIRTDIKSFYESIPQETLMEKIENSTLLTYQSKQFITLILSEYESLRPDKEEKPKIGVPRGVGVSAYLAELYMQDIDQKIKSIKNIAFYSRYVDDIFIIITPQSKIDTYNYLADVRTVVEGGKLELNKDKTVVEFIDRINDLDSGKDVLISFLGYNFKINHSQKRINLTINLSELKKERYKNRIKAAIEDYNEKSKINEKSARKLLYYRLWFLTGNTNLINSKKGIKTGVYYSNSLLSQDEAGKVFRALDGNLKGQILSKLTPYHKLNFNVPNFKQHLIKKFSFELGFKELKFHKFKKDDFREIKKIWNEE